MDATTQINPSRSLRVTVTRRPYNFESAVSQLDEPASGDINGAHNFRIETVGIR